MSSFCIVNLGLFRTGTTMLATALSEVGLVPFHEFPDLDQEQQRQFLLDPKALVREWWHQDGKLWLADLISKGIGVVSDGWLAILCFLEPHDLIGFVDEVHDKHDVTLCFTITTRSSIQSLVRSELHHWIRHDLVKKTGIKRGSLRALLYRRALDHKEHAEAFVRCCQFSNMQDAVLKLPLEEVESWPNALMSLWKRCPALATIEALERAFEDTGVVNANPPLPVEGILLTLRLCNKVGLLQLLDQVEADELCEYLLVLGLDSDEADSEETNVFKRQLLARPRLKGRLSIQTNPKRVKGGPFPICQIWHKMANKAWEEGASWVALLGDDVEIECSFHYQSIYRTFLDIQAGGRYPIWFGCPWFNDQTFPGFPTFPVVGRAHASIFNGLIPEWRQDSFVNQDLDPYLQRLYLKFGAAPPMEDALLVNGAGGPGSAPARYERIPANGWRDWVLSDAAVVGEYLSRQGVSACPKLLLDVVVPAYRLEFDFLKNICNLHVPRDMRTTFIIIVDNPQLLLRHPALESRAGSGLAGRAQELEDLLRNMSKVALGKCNNIRVRCNDSNNGASYSRNRGLDESSAEFVLFLDDDVQPDKDLLHIYGSYLKELGPEQEFGLNGLLGMVEFPRSPTTPLKHAAVLMSYLTFMFEIADKLEYKYPAWGVTANLLVRRTKLRFDTNYAKTGGGEDVDFCLRLNKETNGRLQAAPKAIVHHDFWQGSVFALSAHFFNWAQGDSALFSRFPLFVYRSWPNVVEMTALLVLYPGFWTSKIQEVLAVVLAWIVLDCVVDMLNLEQYEHRCALLGSTIRPRWFYALAHTLANLYVIALEAGRLAGHAKRFEFQNVTQRFDWHCGMLPRSPANFRKKELQKFVLFVVILLPSIRNQVPQRFSACLEETMRAAIDHWKEAFSLPCTG